MISIITPTFNRAATLPRAVESVFGQTYPDWELVIVDDGSTDETTAYLSGLSDPRIQVVRHASNRGVTAAKNSGFDCIRGEWFIMLDSDDEMMPDALATLAECAERTGADVITCNALDSATGEMSGTGPVADGWVTAGEMANSGTGDHWGLTRTDLLGNKRFDERLPGYEDTLWLKVNAQARRYYVHRALAVWHTDGADRVSIARRRTFAQKVEVYSALGEHTGYLTQLRAHDARGYRQLITRVWAARVLRPILSRFGHGIML
jgi:glycosyltransferase involved in cell wall biosynthesis